MKECIRFCTIDLNDNGNSQKIELYEYNFMSGEKNMINSQLLTYQDAINILGEEQSQQFDSVNDICLVKNKTIETVENLEQIIALIGETTASER